MKVAPIPVTIPLNSGALAGKWDSHWSADEPAENGLPRKRRKSADPNFGVK